MKKVLGLAIISIAVFACNDNQSTSIKEDTRDTSSSVVQTPPPPAETNVYAPADGDVTVRDHKVMVMKNGEWVVTKEDIKLNNGVVVQRDRTVKKEGKVVEIQEGVVVNKEGNFFDKTGHAIDNAWEATKDGVKKAGNEIEKGAEKVGDKVSDAVHDDDRK
ncbi:MAG TPA: DUF6799 domain-containing protein [Flavitalea sp.]|nr:DUF6799 domain-containing protein [Flavitalea sp.]